MFPISDQTCDVETHIKFVIRFLSPSENSCTQQLHTYHFLSLIDGMDFEYWF